MSDNITESIKAELGRINDSVKEQGEKALAEAARGIQMSEKTKEKVDELLTVQADTRTRLQDLEQKVVAGFDQGGEVANPLRAALEGASSNVTNFIAARNQSAQVNIPIPRAALTNSGVTGTALNYPGQQVLPQPLSPLLRRLTVRDLLAQGRTSKSVIFYQRETGYTNNAAPVSEGSLKPKSELTSRCRCSTTSTTSRATSRPAASTA
jgi:hypothetical protein